MKNIFAALFVACIVIDKSTGKGIFQREIKCDGLFIVEVSTPAVDVKNVAQEKDGSVTEKRFSHVMVEETKDLNK